MKYRSFNKILIANRGEIALRIIKTIHSLGKKAVVVHSRYDANLPFVKLADEAMLLEGDTLAETYLNINNIIGIAKECNADAIHPGYGFLSENSDFQYACEQNDIVFIGPGAEAIEKMGNKSKAREIAKEAGLPVLKGVKGTAEEIISSSAKLNFPVLIKPSAGGGGKGMQIVNDPAKLENALIEAERLSHNIFGSGELYVEEFLENPRHIEVQLLADAYGNFVHLYDRECSLQRRYQKIIEEAPSPSISVDIRQEITESALKLAKRIAYQNAGTVEFLLDQEGKFYFIEMNTRIQVEHPVTEIITGVDLVEEQIKIAEKRELSFKQGDITIRGHSIEARLYAENPKENFLPSSGHIRIFDHKRVSDRIDYAYAEGCEKTSFYDPLLAKIISSGKNRLEAAKSLSKSINDLHITGLETNRNFLINILDSEDFLENNIHTNYIDQSDSLKENIHRYESKKIVALMAAVSLNHSYIDAFRHSIWNEIGQHRNGSFLEFEFDQSIHKVKILEKRENKEFLFDIEQKEIEVVLMEKNAGAFSCKIDNDKMNCWTEVIASEITIDIDADSFMGRRLDILDRRHIINGKDKESNSNEKNILSPLNGKVVKINTEVSKPVKKGDSLLVIESMKMENNILSPRDAFIDTIDVEINELVASNKVLVTFKE